MGKTYNMDSNIMVTLNKQTIDAYTAGLIDGEGCIRIRKDTYKKRYSAIQYMLVVEVVMRDKQAVEMVHKEYGGSIGINHGYYHWQIYSQNALIMIERIKPYLLIKKTEADLAVEFQSGIFQNTSRKTSEEEVQRRDKIYHEMRNCKYYRRAVAETECKDAYKKNKVSDATVRTV